MPPILTAQRQKWGEYARWSAARLANNEDPRDVDAFLAHLVALKVPKPVKPHDYGLPFPLGLTELLPDKRILEDDVMGPGWRAATGLRIAAERAILLTLPAVAPVFVDAAEKIEKVIRSEKKRLGWEP